MKGATFYLKSVFGNKIDFLYDVYNRVFPIFLSEEFDFLKIKFDGHNREYILTKPKKKLDIKINSIRKLQNHVETLSGCSSILVLEELRLSQRNALIQADIPFVVPNFQIFLPNTMVSLIEKDAIKKDYDSCFSIQTQVVFIHMFLNGIEETNARQLSGQLPLSVATLNRALNELVDRELVYTVGSNTRKIYKRIEKQLFWEKGKEFLFNPVSKTYYSKTKPDGLLSSNESALSLLSNSLNKSPISYYAASGKDINELDKSDFIDRYNLFDDSFYVIEQFKYAPNILSKTPYIDSISLFAQFKDNKDERVQIALDEILSSI